MFSLKFTEMVHESSHTYYNLKKCSKKKTGVKKKKKLKMVPLPLYE